VIEIAVYIEGGGPTVAQREELRRGFDDLFTHEKSRAREKRGGLRLICCGGRQEAYDAFMNALAVNPQIANAFLVDSETAIAAAPADNTGKPDKARDAAIRIAHLQQKDGTDGRGQGDGWQFAGVALERIHLMVQCMETWIVADPDALEGFYKQNFKRNDLPKRINLEEESKADIYTKLESATKNTQKGQYGKIKHASKLLLLIDPEKVAARCPRFSIFRDRLNESIDVDPASA